MRKLTTGLAGILLLLSCQNSKTGATEEFADGQYVQITGRMSREIQQHMMSPPFSGAHTAYLDYRGQQIVLYSREPIRCQGTAVVSGKAMVVQDHGRKGTKNSYSGTHLMVEDVICQ